MSQQVRSIHYSIIPVNPEAHLFQVTCTIQNPADDGQIVWLPAWIPGSYMIRDFSKNIVTIEARSNNQSVGIKKTDKQTWQCEPCQSDLTITYTVYAWDMSVRTAHLDQTHAFFNGSSVFLAVKGQEDQDCSVDIQLPNGGTYKNWQVATGLERDNTKLFQAGRYLAKDYDALIDHPVEMGTFTEASFELNGIPHHIVITGQHQTDMNRLIDDVEKICRTHINMFGELPNMERYIFLLTVVGDGYGGLEHRNSTALICSRKDLPHRNMTKASDGYITLLGLFSHEYFHTWNVKQIKPAEFLPYKLEEESYTTLLWAFEGFTSYYDELGLVRSGVITEKDYLELIGKNITRVIRGSGRFKQTLEESSFDAWSKFYKQDENTPNAIVNYYVKGGLFAFCLDIYIRKYSDNQHSLDDLMRQLWLQHGKTQIGVTTDSIISIANSLTNNQISNFFTDYLSTTNDLPVQECFDAFGINYKLRATISIDDAGGKPASDNGATGFFLGARFANHNLGAKVLVVYDDGDIQMAGLASGDVIIAINKLKVTNQNILPSLAPYSAGDTVTLHVFRRDELYETELTLTAARNDTCYLEIDTEDTAKSDSRDEWLTLSSQNNAH